MAVIASYGSSVTEPAIDIYEKNKLVAVGYGCTAIRLTMDKQRTYFFRTCGRDDAQGLFFAKYAVETMGASMNSRARTMSSPRMFPNRRSDSDSMRAKWPMTSMGNIKGAIQIMGPVK